MADLMQLLEGQVPKMLLNQLSQQIGGDKRTTKDATQTAVGVLMNALSRNVKSPEGAEGLASALDRDHDGSILDDVMGFMSGSKQSANPSMLNGAGILKHVLGGNQNNAIAAIAKMTGMDKSKAGSLLVTLAPVVLGMLGKQKKQKQMNSSNLADFIGQTTQNMNTRNKKTSIIEKVLDADGDGSVIDDIAGFAGRSLFSRLFGRR